MLRRSLLTLIALAISLPVAQAKPPKKPKPDKSPAPAVAVDVIERPERFDDTIDTLPDDFYAARPDRFARWVKSLQDAVGKADEFTSPAERDRLARGMESALEETGNLTPFIYDCHKRYEPEKQRFQFFAFLGDFPFSSELRGGEQPYYRINLLQDDRHLRSYIGSNAYGARVEVFQTIRKYVSLAFQYEDAPRSLFHEDFSRTVPEFRFYLDMVSNEAREQADRISCLILFKLQPAYLVPFTDHHSPTIDSPSDITENGEALVGKIDQLWVYNRVTGKVLLKHKWHPPVPPPPNPNRPRQFSF